MEQSDSPREFMVQGDPVRSGELTTHLSREPSVTLIAQVSPDVVVLSMTPSQADRLQTALRGIRVEPNSTLSQFDRGQI